MRNRRSFGVLWSSIAILRNELRIHVYTVSFSKQEDPKSITFMPLFVGCFNKIFSGFKSAWIIRRLDKNRREYNNCIPNRRINPRENPYKILAIFLWGLLLQISF